LWQYPRRGLLPRQRDAWLAAEALVPDSRTLLAGGAASDHAARRVVLCDCPAHADACGDGGDSAPRQRRHLRRSSTQGQKRRNTDAVLAARKKGLPRCRPRISNVVPASRVFRARAPLTLLLKRANNRFRGSTT